MSKQLFPFDITLGNTRFHVRPIVPDDQGLMKKGFAQLSKESRYLRFFAVPPKLTDYQLKYFTEVDGVDHVAWGVLDITEEIPKAVGAGRFIRLKEEPDTAEVALTIIDAYQRKSLGRVLFSVLNIAAAEAGISTFRYYVMESNRFVLDILSNVGIINKAFENDVIIADLKVHGTYKSLPDVSSLRTLANTMKTVEELASGI